MLRRFGIAFVGCVVLGIGVGSWAQDAKEPPKTKAADQFARLKKLAGDWSGTASAAGGAAMEVKVIYRVTAAGSAVAETLFPGTEHEMVTMYFRDGDRLLLTHYCAAGNQPRMKAELGDSPDKLEFKYLDGTNLDPAKDMHMHEATIEFVDDNHIRGKWVGYADGKPSDTLIFDMHRKQNKD